VSDLDWGNAKLAEKVIAERRELKRREGQKRLRDNELESLRGQIRVLETWCNHLENMACEVERVGNPPAKALALRAIRFLRTRGSTTDYAPSSLDIDAFVNWNETERALDALERFPTYQEEPETPCACFSILAGE